MTLQIIPAVEHSSETDVLDERITELVETVRAHRERIVSLEA